MKKTNYNLDLIEKFIYNFIQLHYDFGNTFNMNERNRYAVAHSRIERFFKLPDNGNFVVMCYHEMLANITFVFPDYNEELLLDTNNYTFKSMNGISVWFDVKPDNEVFMDNL